MNEIHASQVKAARALLNLSQEELAAMTGLSITTIRKIEGGAISPRSKTMNAIKHAIEGAGWEFIHPEGIRRRQNEIVIYEGVGGTDMFFDDVLDTVRQKGGDVYGSIISQEMLTQSLGAHAKSNSDRLIKLNELARVKCLLSQPDEMPILLAGYQFRTVLRCYMSAVPYFVYGDRFVLVLPEGRDSFKYILHRSGSLVQHFRTRFLELWDVATPFMTFRETEPTRAQVSG